MPTLNMFENARTDLSFTTDDGREVLRPCGLSDTPGYAGLAGVVASMLGLAWALRPVRKWQRLAGFGIAGVGMAVILLSQIRTALVVQLLSFVILGILFLIQRDVRRLSLLSMAASVIVVGAIGWVVREGGEGAIKRFYSLIEEKPAELYSSNRGVFLKSAFGDMLWLWPLGAGMGRFGVIGGQFGNPAVSFEKGGIMYVEIQWQAWCLEGGAPLMFMYSAAIAVAMISMLHVAFRCRDPDLAFWGAVNFAMSVGTIAGCFVGQPFEGPSGAQFWMLTAVIHAAAQRAGFGPRPKAPPTSIAHRPPRTA
jgi:hypothetical protein